MGRVAMNMQLQYKLVHESAAPTPIEFIDHHTVNWSQVRRTRYWLHQRFRYEYPGPVRELRQRLVVVPSDRHGHQQLQDFRVHVSAPAAASAHEIDGFGNRVFHFYIPEVGAGIEFEVWASVEHTPHQDALPHVPVHEVARYLAPTELTACDATLAAAARDLAAQASSPADLAGRINDWTFGAMQYKGGVTHVGTTAAQALALGKGVCQDYAHIMLALCRAAGLPARYVSGHLLGEGGSHAWVEVLFPSANSSDFVAVAYDPTHRGRVGLNYITVAVGRDYRDVAPTSGTFLAPFQGQLTATKRAGLTAVEYC